MEIKKYQKDCFANYKREIKYPEDYTYFYGNPINVLVPIETAINGVMIVGAYPSAKFYTVNGIADTPLADNDSPFSNESYFDGSRVRTIPSGKELNEVILEKIGVKREDCWVTDLVKVFLFKQGHINRYIKLGKTNIFENRSKFLEYAKKSIYRLQQEIDLANPKAIILLGIEVIKALFNISDQEAKSYLDGETRIKEINGIERNFICLPHPGILMKKFEKNPWPEKFENEIAPKAKTNIKKLIRSIEMDETSESIKISYSSTRLLFKRDEIEPLDWEDKIRIYASNDNCSYEMTKREFYEVFSNVVKTRSYLEAGIYHYVKTPAKAFQFIVSY